MRRRVTYLLGFYAVTVTIFIVAKVVFMLACHETEPALTLTDMARVVAHGLTLDLSTSLYLIIVPLLLAISTLWVRLPRGLFLGYDAVVAAALSLAFVADTSMYPFWHFKLDVSWLQYLDTPGGITASVSTGYLVLRLTVTAVAAVLIYKVYAAIPLPTRGGHWGEAVAGLLCVPLLSIGIRGGVNESTTNIGQAYFSEQQFLNHAAVNPVFNFLYSLFHQLDNLEQYHFLSDGECEELVQDIYTTESLLADTLLNTQRPNIVIILMESAGEQFAQAMPHLQQLKREGVYFSQCYANSWRTDRGTVCVLSGYPSFPSISVMKMPEKSRTLPSLARTLTAEGYDTHYLYGGDINFTNFRSYLFSTGWQQVTSMDDYSQSEQHTAQWGVRDDITLQTLYDRITNLKAGGKKLIGYSTLSSHEPWDVPVRKLDDPVLNAFAYLDDCLYDFVERLKQTPAWSNLLLIFVADHGVNYQGIDQTTPLQKNHIPMIWTGGAVRQPRVIETLSNQSDLAATLLGQLGLAHGDFRFSRDVLSQSYTHPVAVHNFHNAQWVTDSTGHLLYDFDARQPIAGKSSDSSQLLKLSKAILQATHRDLQERRSEK